MDIMRELDGWFPVAANTQTGTLEKPDKSFVMSFSDSIFNFTADKSYKTTVEEIADEVSNLWKIIQVNLDLEEFTRLATRLYNLMPCLSIEDAERKLGKSVLNVVIPANVESNFNIKNRHVIIVFESNNIEYRVSLNTVTRYEGIQPSDILKLDPRFLSKDQKKYRHAKQQQITEYSANPMYAIALDIDCVSVQPETVKVKEFIFEQQEEINRYFMPILEHL